MASVERGLLLTGHQSARHRPDDGDISIGAFGLWIEGGVGDIPGRGDHHRRQPRRLLRGVELIGKDSGSTVDQRPDHQARRDDDRGTAATAPGAGG